MFGMAPIIVVALLVGKATVSTVTTYVSIAVVACLGTVSLLWWLDQRSHRSNASVVSLG